MDEPRFDSLVRDTALHRSRRRLIASLAGGLLAALPALPWARGDASAACVTSGGKCERNRDCCAGRVCKRRCCRCRNGHPRCGGFCCAAGQVCLNLVDAKVCWNGTKQVGDACDPSRPKACSSGVCGCETSGACICRQSFCIGPNGTCTHTSECCEGSCSVPPFHTCSA